MTLYPYLTLNTFSCLFVHKKYCHLPTTNVYRRYLYLVSFLLGPEALPAVLLSVVCLIPLIMMRSVRNLVAPPILIITDSKEFAFNFPTVRIQLLIIFCSGRCIVLYLFSYISFQLFYLFFLFLFIWLFFNLLAISYWCEYTFFYCF